jgi:hypothetical protein
MPITTGEPGKVSPDISSKIKNQAWLVIGGVGAGAKISIVRRRLDRMRTGCPSNGAEYSPNQIAGMKMPWTAIARWCAD